MTQVVVESGEHANISASAQVLDGPGRIIGIFVASTTAGTIKVWDALTATGDIVVNTFTPLAGAFYPIPARCVIGAYVTLGGTIDCTVFYRKD